MSLWKWRPYMEGKSQRLNFHWPFPLWNILFIFNVVLLARVLYLLASILQYSQQLYVNKKDTHVKFKNFIKKIPEKSTLLLDWLIDWCLMSFWKSLHSYRGMKSYCIKDLEFMHPYTWTYAEGDSLNLAIVSCCFILI